MLLNLGDMNGTSVTFGNLSYIRRATPSAPVGVALGARSVVWSRFRAGEFEDRMIRPWVKIIWSLDGEGAIRLSGRVYRLPAGMIALFFPGMLHEAWALPDSRSGWEARWVTMDGPLCASFAKASGLTHAGIYPQRQDLHPIFDRYRDGILLATPEGANEAELAAHELLLSIGSRAATGGESKDLLMDEALGLLRLHWAKADFSIAQLAALMGLHRSVLSRRFNAAVGVSPQRHLMDLRMGNALTLLSSTDLQIKEVAFLCGFTDAGYFTRLFYRSQGMTPGQYRMEEN